MGTAFIMQANKGYRDYMTNHRDHPTEVRMNFYTLLAVDGEAGIRPETEEEVEKLRQPGSTILGTEIILDEGVADGLFDWRNPMLDRWSK